MVDMRLTSSSRRARILTRCAFRGVTRFGQWTPTVRMWNERGNVCSFEDGLMLKDKTMPGHQKTCGAGVMNVYHEKPLMSSHEGIHSISCPGIISCTYHPSTDSLTAINFIRSPLRRGSLVAWVCLSLLLPSPRPPLFLTRRSLRMLSQHMLRVRRQRVLRILARLLGAALGRAALVVDVA
jgi:hypothetical protein